MGQADQRLCRSLMSSSERECHDVIFIDTLAKIEWLLADDLESDSSVEPDRPRGLRQGREPDHISARLSGHIAAVIHEHGANAASLVRAVDIESDDLECSPTFDTRRTFHRRGHVRISDWRSL